MDVPEAPVEMYFFPFFGGGHQIPMIDMARVFASHGAKATIITTLSNSLRFRNSVFRDQKSGLPITIYGLRLPDDAESPNADMSAPPITDTSILQEPFRLFLMENHPDCIVVDMFHRWAADVIDELGIKRIVFNGNGCFSRCVGENIRRYKPDEQVGSDSEPFVVPGLPDRIELSKSQLPFFARQRSKFSDKMGKSEDKSFGVIVNSFYELEPNYADYMKKEMGKKAWIIGPVSLCNRNVFDKVERGQTGSVDEQNCLNWLNSMEPNSVIYISFGSLARLLPKQLLEIAHGLEASEHPFIWVVGKVFDESDGKNPECYLPQGFEKRMKESKRGLVLRGWAPQLLILEHVSVGGFMTHCGWNSTLEGVCAGMPMITWPMSAEQFYNEKLISEVLRIGVEVGSKEWVSWNVERKEVIGREKVEAAVRRLMGGGYEAAEMRRRAKALGEKAHRAVEEGGSSYGDAVALISELKSLLGNY